MIAAFRATIFGDSGRRFQPAESRLVSRVGSGLGFEDSRRQSRLASGRVFAGNSCASTHIDGCGWYKGVLGASSVDKVTYCGQGG